MLCQRSTSPNALVAEKLHEPGDGRERRPCRGLPEEIKSRRAPGRIARPPKSVAHEGRDQEGDWKLDASRMDGCPGSAPSSWDALPLSKTPVTKPLEETWLNWIVPCCAASSLWAMADDFASRRAGGMLAPPFDRRIMSGGLNGRKITTRYASVPMRFGTRRAAMEAMPRIIGCAPRANLALPRPMRRRA